jgi:hypothetical protein
MTRRFVVVGAGRMLVARLVFGTDHSPLSLRIWPCLGTSRGKKYTWSMLPPLTQRYVFVPRMKKNSPIIVSQKRQKHRR